MRDTLCTRIHTQIIKNIHANPHVVYLEIAQSSKVQKE